MTTHATRWVPAAMCLALGACATVAPPAGTAGYPQYMAQAEAAQAAGATGAALAAYAGAIEADPTRTDPWLATARLQRAADRPVEALAAVQEVLRRDPTDEVANGLYLDIALELAADGMARLRAVPPELHGAYVERWHGLVGEAVELFGDEVVPVETRARYGREAVERYRRNLPVRPDGKPEEVGKVPDPLDVLGGG